MAEQIAYVLTISGSDSSGCAGMQADNRAIHAAGAMPLNVITANTLQTPAGVLSSCLVDASLVEAQIRALLDAYPVAAIKIGMLGSAAVVDAVASVLSDYPNPFVVLDPVILSTSGSELLDADGLARLNAALMPHVDLVTPNLDEQLHIRPTGRTAVLVKGGHSGCDQCCDVLILPSGERLEFSETRVDTLNSRGTGCVLSAAIAAFRAQGQGLEESVASAKTILYDALKTRKGVSYHGAGPSFV